jgi:hypothetical protein
VYMGSLSSSLAPRWYELDVFAAGKCGQIVPRKLQRDFNAESEVGEREQEAATGRGRLQLID